MSDNGLPPGWVDGALFNKNANKFPEEKLVPFRNKHVAWNMEASAILASGTDWEELLHNLDSAGIRLDQVVLGYIPYD